MNTEGKSENNTASLMSFANQPVGWQQKSQQF